MRLLLAVGQPVLADQIRVGLAAFGDIEVDHAIGLMALDKVHRIELDALIVALDPAVPENQQLFERVLEEPHGFDILVVAHEAVQKKLRDEKTKGLIFAFLRQPLDPVELFRTINRLRQKRVPARAR